MKRLIIFFINLIIVTSIFSKTVYYPNIDGLGTDAFGYQLLELVLSKVNKDYEVIITPKAMNSGRALNELEKGVLSVVDSGIGHIIEDRFLAVYIPIDMGLTGWRIFIIHSDNQKEFAQIKNLKTLKKKIAGQGVNWTDTQILNKAGIKVITSTKVELLIKMVERKRFDFFPLGVNEAHGFLKTFGNDSQNLEIEESIVLVYPFARLYYVQKDNYELHTDISRGLELAYEDGSYKKFIENHPYFKEGLKKSNLKNRTIIKIDNPFMTERVRQINPKWWFHFEK